MSDRRIQVKAKEKIMKRLMSAFVGALVFVGLVPSAVAATVWLPTSTDINTFSLSLSLRGFNFGTGTFGIFGDVPETDDPWSLALSITGSDRITFEDLGGSWLITNDNNQSSILTGDLAAFQLRYLNDSLIWEEDSSYAQLPWSDNWYSLTYDSFDGVLLAFDVTPAAINDSAAADDIAVTPLPSAFILFGSALLGLAAVIRKRVSRHDQFANINSPSTDLRTDGSVPA
jgi:hypothetical protein